MNHKYVKLGMMGGLIFIILLLSSVQFVVLEKNIVFEFDSTWQVRFNPCQYLSGPHEHGRVGIMSARMHDTNFLAIVFGSYF